MELLTVYRRVFDRKNMTLTDFETFLFKPQVVDSKFEARNINVVLGNIKRIKDKEYRNFKKREELPVVNLFSGGFLAIDIDEVYGDEKEIERLVSIFEQDPYCHAVKGTPSKNLVAIYKVDCSLIDFPKVYYKLYLELTLRLSKNIDYLPDAERLRYLSNGEIYHYNENSLILSDMLEIDEVPVIKRVVEDTEEVDKTEKGKKLKRRTKRMYIKGSYNAR